MIIGLLNWLENIIQYVYDSWYAYIPIKNNIPNDPLTVKI